MVLISHSVFQDLLHDLKDVETDLQLLNIESSRVFEHSLGLDGLKLRENNPLGVFVFLFI